MFGGNHGNGLHWEREMGDRAEVRASPLKPIGRQMSRGFARRLMRFLGRSDAGQPKVPAAILIHLDHNGYNDALLLENHSMLFAFILTVVFADPAAKSAPDAPSCPRRRTGLCGTTIAWTVKSTPSLAVRCGGTCRCGTIALPAAWPAAKRMTRPAIISTGEVVAGTPPIVSLRQDGPKGLVCYYTGKRTAADRIVGTWYDNRGSSGDFEFTIEKKK